MAYPAHVTDSFGSLASYLLSPPTPDEITPGSGLTAVAQAKIEKLVHCEIEHRIAGFRVADSSPSDGGPVHIWAIISSMQKAIRFRDRENAMFAARIGWAKDPSRTFRRLGVISLEDTGAGSLFGIMMALASLGNSAWRNRVGDRRLAVWLADQLATAPKDRSLCEFLVSSELRQRLEQEGDQPIVERRANSPSDGSSVSTPRAYAGSVASSWCAQVSRDHVAPGPRSTS